MKKTALLVALFVLVPASLWAAYPLVCKGPAFPSAAACGGIQAQGCCDGSSRVLWCGDGGLVCQDCQGAGLQCGWNKDEDRYACVSEGAAAEPTNTYPMSCESCGAACDPGKVCLGGDCAICDPQCTGRTCGDDGCGGTCGTCDAGFFCNAGNCLESGCQALPGAGCAGCGCEACVCGGKPECCTGPWTDACAQACKTCGNCGSCGNGTCEAAKGETCATCGADCKCAAGDRCSLGSCCKPDCEGRACGSDGCGGTCGDCPLSDCSEASGICGEQPVCQAAKVAGCNQALPAATPGVVEIHKWKCSSYLSLPGKERIWSFKTDKAQKVKVGPMAAGTKGYTLLLLKGSCSPASCIATSSTSIEFTSEAGKDYFIVLDSDGTAAQPPEVAVSCQDLCVPACLNKDCGSDGCGGVCGQCEGSDLCLNGVCTPCTKKCDNKECGSDGCGGTCGTCPDNGYCVGGLCLVADSCKGACGSSSPNASCYCDSGCFSWGDCCDDICEACPDLGQCCKPKCDGKQCGDDGCGGVCGKCAKGTLCKDGVCEACTPNCFNRECGDDGCGGVCGLCLTGACIHAKCTTGPGCYPSDTGGCSGCPCEACVCAKDSWCCTWEWDESCVKICLEQCEAGCGKLTDCGDTLCDPSKGENCESCEQDCACKDGQVCGLSNGKATCIDDFCAMGTTDIGCCDNSTLRVCLNEEVSVMQNCATSGQVCGWYSGFGTEPDGYYCGSSWEIDTTGDPSGKYPLECVTCIPDCTGKECGDNGCDGNCGLCGIGKMCNQGKCCTIDCKGRECGDNGCGGTCGMCPMGKLCNVKGICKPPCYPDCGDRNCGDDGCEGSCGECQFGTTCADGHCVPACQPDCENKQCGDNGCGGDCGSCAEESVCVAGRCVSEVSTDSADQDSSISEIDIRPSSSSSCTFGQRGSVPPVFLLLLAATGLAFWTRRGRKTRGATRRGF